MIIEWKNSVEKSPSPQTFKEPEMVVYLDDGGHKCKNRDLNASSTKEKNNQTIRLYFLLVVILAFLLYNATLLINKGTFIVHIETPKPYTDVDSLYTRRYSFFKEKLIRSKYIFGKELTFLKCEISKAWMDCCGTFINTALADTVEQCTVSDMLDILSQHKLKYNNRNKREFHKNYFDEPLPHNNKNISHKAELPYINNPFNYFLDYNPPYYEEYKTENQDPLMFNDSVEYDNRYKEDIASYKSKDKQYNLQDSKQSLDVDNIRNIAKEKRYGDVTPRAVKIHINTMNTNNSLKKLTIKGINSFAITKIPRTPFIISDKPRTPKKHLKNITAIIRNSKNMSLVTESEQSESSAKEGIDISKKTTQNSVQNSQFPFIKTYLNATNIYNISNISTLSNLNLVNDLYNTKGSRTIDRRTNTESNFRTKIKTNSFPTANEDVQINHQTLVNPCFYRTQFGSRYILGSSFDSQLLKIIPVNTPKISQYILNPSMYPYMQSTFIQPPYFPNYGIPIQQFHQEQPGYNDALQVNNPRGQYYVCNPILPPTNNIASIPGIEVRRDAFNLQDVMETIPKHLTFSNQTREVIISCPSTQQSCTDGSRCISNQHICDNEIHCDDGSDEMFCSCRDRVGKIRTCDGYSDCPNSEDEQGCFGCAQNEFSCNDWSKFRRSTCIPMEQRCDNIKQCEITGKDENDCVVLTDYIGNQPQFKISNAVGFLHRNFKGKWYPICLGTDIFAEEVCKIESGPSVINPKLHMLLTNNDYSDEFINILPNNDVSLVKTCVQDRAAFVECPPLYCGLRMIIKNPYRPDEIDTSIEDVINELQRLSEKHLNMNTLKAKTNSVASRVVGGNPSQPAAWPWLVSIYKNGIFHCGGVLINDMWIVTAAHCVDRYWKYYFDIQAGMLRRFSYSPMEQRRWAAIIKPHDNYDRNSLRNDIALIKLSSALRYNRYVRPICLPSEETAGRDFLRGPPPGTICTTAGWGATIEHGSDPDHLREVEIPVLENCKDQEDRIGDEICAGLSEGGKDACQGDSGGPFMCRNPNNPSQWYLAGIVSHGEGCARPNKPGVYTKVSKFIGWIVETIGHENNQYKVPLQKCPGYLCKGIKICLPTKRRCDKIVDCLLGDDELGCENNIRDIFKHSDGTYLVGLPVKVKDENETMSNFMYNILDDIIPNILIKRNKSLVDLTTINHSSGMVQVHQVENIFRDTNTIISPQNNNQSTTAQEPKYFNCKRMLQIIPITKRCNKIVDCEDSTDEVDCLCVDYVRHQYPQVICDGMTDCHDISDEVNCAPCKSTEHYCRRSKTCIDSSKRCNSVNECSKNEDEWDCVALTDGVTLTLDSDLRPKVNMCGIITINRFGVWRPLCANIFDNEAYIATNVCNLLGFEEYIDYHKYQVKDKPLNITVEGFKPGNYTNQSSDMCSGLYVRCSNISLDSSIHNVYQDNIASKVEFYTAPWNAVIYSNGIYSCMGTILNTRWIITSLNCFDSLITLNLTYVAVLLGKGKSPLAINGPHEQILRVTKSVIIERSDIMLLYLEENISFNRYIRPSNINARKHTRRKEKCVAVGLEVNKVKYVLLRPIGTCPIGFTCFESKETQNCWTLSPWSGTIVCDSGNGWYPSAIYYERTGHCGLASIKQYTSITFFQTKILEAMKQIPDKPDLLPPCDGFRCRLGQCIEKNHICNGIPNCRNGEDEDPDLCFERLKVCHLTDECACPSNHLKCKNNKCVPKTSFCNRINDCGDYSDEPHVCSCKEYLLLTNSTKLCDGVVHCMDRTDEDSKLCTCKLNSMKCGNTPFCISNDMICDGFNDCPNGEDESECITLRAKDGKRSNAGEVIKRTGGIWHSGCFNLNYTTTELEKICQILGFTRLNDTQLIVSSNVSNVTTLRPEIDEFNLVWIHRAHGNKVQLRIRTGYEPYVKFVTDSSCFRLFINCM